MPKGSNRKSYEENMYNWLKRQGLAEKYGHPGIYSISIGNKLAYVGKSNNMLRRISQHYVGIKQRTEHKYSIMAQAQKWGYRIKFDVLYYAKAKNWKEINEEIGNKEGEYIRKLRPPLNSQIPKAENWRKFTYNADAGSVTLDKLLQEDEL